MKLLIEGFNYKEHGPQTAVYKALKGSGIISDLDLESTNRGLTLEYVGYFYNKTIDEVVFILPKVVLTGLNNETVFDVSPEELVDFDELAKKLAQEKSEAMDSSAKQRLTLLERDLKDQHHFLSELAIWIYRSICVYRDQAQDTEILTSANYGNDLKGNVVKKLYTLFDVVLALRDFNRENKDYLMFLARLVHSGHNKIQWTKTISHTTPFFQERTPLYLDPVTKKKNVDYDEELLIIYYSILHHIKEHYGLRLNINLNFPIIKGSKFHSLCESGRGCRRLKAIKYKYFSDKDLRLWNLCYAYFDQCHKITIRGNHQDYLLAHKYQGIFENMIDSLLGDSNLAGGLKQQRDNKRVDHMFIYDSLIEAGGDQKKYNTYYIADSKYYSRVEIKALHSALADASEDTPTRMELQTGIRLKDDSIYKQFTYARNVIQWNMDLFMPRTGKPKDTGIHTHLRPDELTEGYNVIPNFFISAYIPVSGEDNVIENTDADEQKILVKDYDFDHDYLKSTGVIEYNRHFENRLFDRDTLLLSYYDVNFLFIVSLYGQDNKIRQAAWRDAVKKKFRLKIQKRLDELYTFYILTPKYDNWEETVRQNFHKLSGKLYRPENDSQYLVLALLKNSEKSKALLDKFHVDLAGATSGNDDIKDLLKTAFDIEDLKSIADFESKAIVAKSRGLPPPAPSSSDGVLMIMVETRLSPSERMHSLSASDSFHTYLSDKLTDATIAVGVKTESKKTMLALANMPNIKYVLFHAWNEDAYQLYPIAGSAELVSNTEVSGVRWGKTPYDFYIQLTLDADRLMDERSISLRLAGKRGGKSSEELEGSTYDVQYMTLEQLQN